MFDPNQFDDDVVLTTSEVLVWTGLKRRALFTLVGLKSLDHIRSREHCYRAGDVKDAILNRRRDDPRPQLVRRIS